MNEAKCREALVTMASDAPQNVSGFVRVLAMLVDHPSSVGQNHRLVEAIQRLRQAGVHVDEFVKAFGEPRELAGTE